MGSVLWVEMFTPRLEVAAAASGLDLGCGGRSWSIVAVPQPQKSSG